MLRRTPRAGGRKTLPRITCLSTHSAGRRLNISPASSRRCEYSFMGAVADPANHLSLMRQPLEDVHALFTGNNETAGTESNDETNGWILAIGIALTGCDAQPEAKLELARASTNPAMVDTSSGIPGVTMADLEAFVQAQQDRYDARECGTCCHRSRYASGAWTRARSTTWASHRVSSRSPDCTSSGSRCRLVIHRRRAVTGSAR
jgi:hypothetical protein